jgi:ClpP class serine protease
VFTGRQALALGLVDALGYEEDALVKAAALGGIKGTPRVFRLASPAVSLVSALLSGRFNQSILPENFLNDLLSPKLEYRWTGQ